MSSFLLNCRQAVRYCPQALFSTASGSSKSQGTQTTKKFSPKEYKVPEYYSYGTFSFYDLERQIDDGKRRLPQPVAGVPDKQPETNPPPAKSS